MRLLVHGLAGYTKGGIETFVLGMASHLPEDIIFDYVLEDKCAERRFPGKGDTLLIAPKRHMIANLRSWGKLLRERKAIDSAVYFNWYSMAWLFPAIIARAKGYRVIIHAHNNDLHNCSFLQRLMHSINRQLQKTMKITRLTNSELSAKFFFGNKPAKMIYNAIDTNLFAYNEAIRRMIRNQLGLAGKHVYGFAGRIAYQKNPLFLIDVFHEISKRDSNAAFLVCGDGDLYEETKRKSDSYNLNTLFVGSVSNIQDYYQAMDVFILPSRFEGLGIVLIEAQCSGLPCIASDEVIPKDVEVTDLSEFVKLDNNPKEWANKAVKATDKESRIRDTYSVIIEATRFNVYEEAKVLEKVIQGGTVV